ncbi:MAG: ribonuclease HII [Candidatus Paceibacterota bacterium]|jgi:ribonuclease HII
MKYIVGIDEVGRGPLAGPVTVCVVVCEENLYKKLKRNKSLPPLGKDSKKLSPELRQKYAKYLKHTEISYVVVNVSNRIIDKKGISFAIRFAIEKGFEKLKIKNCELKILLDGGLKAPKKFINQRTIIRGDEKEKIIAWASILAKVSRDTLMCRLAKKYPKYGLEIHKGYGTLRHRGVLKKVGLSDIHRKSFCRFVSNYTKG